VVEVDLKVVVVDNIQVKVVDMVDKVEQECLLHQEVILDQVVVLVVMMVMVEMVEIIGVVLDKQDKVEQVVEEINMPLMLVDGVIPKVVVE
jgi:hypothetical protein